jgi:hypothetical protein
MFKQRARDSERATDGNVERLRAMYHALGPGFPAEALRLFDREPGADGGGWCLRHNGHVLRCLSAGELASADLFSLPPSWEVMRVVVHNLMPKRDIVTVTGSVYCRPRGSWETMRLPLLHVWTMCADRALRFESYLDGIELSRIDELVSCA